MPAIVYTLAERTDSTGYVLGVFEDRSMAVSAAISQAEHRLRRCCAQDAITFGESAGDPSIYAVVRRTVGDTTDVFVRHQASGEDDDLNWCVRTFEIIRPQAL